MRTESAKSVSRRSLMTALASFPLLASTSMATKADNTDFELIELGRQFASFATQVDFVIEQRLDLPWSLLTQLSNAQEEILNREAKTTAGLFAKAQTICWGRLGDLEDSSDMAGSDKMVLSILRDLIRLHDPSLEHPGALKNLLQETLDHPISFDN